MSASAAEPIEGPLVVAETAAPAAPAIAPGLLEELEGAGVWLVTERERGEGWRATTLRVLRSWKRRPFRRLVVEATIERGPLRGDRHGRRQLRLFILSMPDPDLPTRSLRPLAMAFNAGELEHLAAAAVEALDALESRR